MTSRPRPASLRACPDVAAARAPAVSGWSVGQHVEHCLLATIGIAAALAGSSPPPPRPGLALKRRMLILTGWIPRGRARAPAAVSPQVEPGIERLQALLEQADAALADAAQLPQDAWFRHFALGPMDRDTSLAFLAVHDRHHLKIVRDILRG